MNLKDKQDIIEYRAYLIKAIRRHGGLIQIAGTTENLEQMLEHMQN